MHPKAENCLDFDGWFHELFFNDLKTRDNLSVFDEHEK